MLGPLEVLDDDGVHREPTAARQRRLLLALLVWRGDTVSIDRLLQAVWGDALPREPVRSLRTYIARLRRVVEPDRTGSAAGVLVGGPGGYALRLHGHELDVADFERLVATAEATVEHDPRRASYDVARALALWRGPALAEVADEQWAVAEAIRLEELRSTALELRFRCLIELGDLDEAIGGLRRHVQEHPLRERPQHQLLLALGRAGRIAEVTEAFRSFRTRLAEETGLDPSDELQGLHVRLISERRPLPSDAERVHHLPTPRTSFVGREADLGSVLDLVGSARLVTLTGIGGAGKTRLALEVARRLVERFSDGVCLVELASLSDPELVVTQVADAIGLVSPGGFGSGGSRTIADEVVVELHDRHLLLLIDNAEHLMDATATLVELLLERCPRVSVLMTSREPSFVDGERLWPVGPLTTATTDGSDPEALRLLVERTVQVRPDFRVTPEDREVLLEICRRLDGIPLALELASGRLAHLSAAEVASRLGDRLRSLTGGRRRTGRQRTLQAAIGWSYDLLDDDERALLRDLSVFAGSTELEAIEGICRPPREGRDVLPVLGSLVAKSLVVAEPAVGGTRHRLLESVRLYAEDASVAAGEASSLRRRHRDRFVDWLERSPWDHRVASPEVARAMDERHDDLRHALEYSRAEHEHQLAARQLCAMSALFCVEGHLEEGRRWHEWASTLGELEPEVRARLDVHRAWIDAWRSGQPLPWVADVLTAAVELLAPSVPEVALAHSLLAVHHSSLTQDPVRMLHHATAAIELAREARAPQLAGFAASIAGGAHLIRRDPAAAVATIEAALDDPAWDDLHDGLRVRAHLAVARHLAGDHRGAAVDARTALRHLRPVWHHDALGTLALASAAQGDLDSARGFLTAALDALDATRTADLIRSYDVAIVLGAVAVHEGDPRRACRLLATMRWTTNPTTYGLYLDYRDRLIERMDPDERRTAVAQGLELDVREELGRERARLAGVTGDAASGR